MSNDDQERKQPEVVGKPNPYVVELIQKEHNIINRERMLVVGDRPDTDVLMGNNAGIASCLVFTGVVTSEQDF